MSTSSSFNLIFLNMSAQKIILLNQKGGVGKTTTCVNLGSSLCAMGYKVLLVDFDSQGNLTGAVSGDSRKPTMYDVIVGRVTAQDAVQETPFQNLFLIPGSIDLAGLNVELVGEEDNNYFLKKRLAELDSQFDFIFVDCPPSLGVITMNALAASNKLIVPMKPDLMSSYGLSMMDTFCAEMQDLNPGIHIDFIFFNVYEKGQTMTDTVEADVREKYGDRVLDTVVRKNNDVAKAAFEYTDVVSAYPSSNGATDFKALVDELLEKM